MLRFTPQMSVARDAVVSGIPVLKFFSSVGQRGAIDVFAALEQDLLEQGYSESTANVLQNRIMYLIMVNANAEYPSVVLYPDDNRVYAVAFTRHDQSVVEQFLRYVLVHGSVETSSVETARSGDRSVVRVNYATERDPRRGLIEAVAMTTRERALRSNMIVTTRDGRATVEFEIVGKDHEAAADEIRNRIRSELDIEFDDPNPHPGEVLDTEFVKEDEETAMIHKVVAGVLRRQAVRKTVRSVVERAGVFDDAGVAVGDRVVINDGSAREPVYMVGTVSHVYPERRRIDVTLDNSKTTVEQIDNGPTGMLGFQRDRRTKADPILEIHVAHWLDRNRWTSAHARALIERFERRH